MWRAVIEFLEKPRRIDRQIQKLIGRISRKGRRVHRISLNVEETQIFWEDLTDEGLISEDYSAFVADGLYDYFDVKIRLERNVESGINPED